MTTTTSGWWSRPQDFHCEHCDALVHTPNGAWICQGCSEPNRATDAGCTSCKRWRYLQRVQCGVCRRGTSVPTTQLSSQARQWTRRIWTGLKKAVSFASGEPYVDCPRCGDHILVLRTDVGATPVPEEKEPPPQSWADERGDVLKPASSSSKTTNVQRVDMTCPKCLMPLRVKL